MLLNGSWDTSSRIPCIVAEMHNVNEEELQLFQRRQQRQQEQARMRELVASPGGSDSAGAEADCADVNLSWLLNYKIQELPPVPGELTFAGPPRGSAVAAARLREGRARTFSKCWGRTVYGAAYVF